MSRKPKRKPRKQVEDHAEYLEAMIRVVERHPRVRTAKLGEVVIQMGPSDEDLPDAVGFEVPMAPESEYEPDET